MENYQKTAVFPGGYDQIGENKPAATAGLGSMGLMFPPWYHNPQQSLVISKMSFSKQ